MATGELNHSYSFWTMLILIFIPFYFFLGHPLQEAEKYQLSVFSVLFTFSFLKYLLLENCIKELLTFTVFDSLAFLLCLCQDFARILARCETDFCWHNGVDWPYLHTTNALDVSRKEQTLFWMACFSTMYHSVPQYCTQHNICR